MTRVRQLLVFSALLGLVLAAPAMAQGYLDDFAKDFDGASKKIGDLAEAIPAELYGWRPAEGVRSVSESIVHVAGANFFLSKALGVEMPKDFSRDAEKTVTAKKDVIAMLQKSQEHVRQAIAKTTAEQLGQEVEVFGGKHSRRGVFMIIVGHSHEHLGQLIAYGRSNGVVPPWSKPSE